MIKVPSRGFDMNTRKGGEAEDRGAVAYRDWIDCGFFLVRGLYELKLM